jgi:hypothetical protein
VQTGSPSAERRATAKERVSEPAPADSYELSNDAFWAIDMPAPETGDELDLMLIASMME